MIGCCWEKNLMALVMEYCGMGTATDVLRREGKDFTWGDPLLKWATDVSKFRLDLSRARAHPFPLARRSREP